jgi:hypothetical protein
LRPPGILPLPKPCRATGHDENGRNGARITSPIGTCKTRAVEPCACPRDLFTRLAHGHLAKNIDALRSWTCMPAAKPSQQAHPGDPSERVMSAHDGKSVSRHRRKSCPQAKSQRGGDDDYDQGPGSGISYRRTARPPGPAGRGKVTRYQVPVPRTSDRSRP